MPYKCNGRVITPGQSFQTADGATVTNRWAEVFSTEQLTARGVTFEADKVRPSETPYRNADGTEKDLAAVKAVAVAGEKNKAGILLKSTDWYVTRKAEKETAIPSNVVTYRDGVRTACAARESELNGAADMDALQALIENAETIWDSENEKEIDNPAPHLTSWPVLAE